MTLFLDTSIQISRFTSGRKLKKKIKETLARHNYTLTGLVVQQEFKRRLLKELKYIKNVLEEEKSLKEAMHRVLGLFGKRKMIICMRVLIDSIQPHTTEADMAEKAARFLDVLSRNTMRRFKKSVDSVLQSSECACAKSSTDAQYCSDCEGQCKVGDFLNSQLVSLKKIETSLAAIEDKNLTAELITIKQKIALYLSKPTSACALNLCLEAGDFLIALESSASASFYSINKAESVHLCKALKQKFIYRPPSYKNEEVVHDFTK